MTNIALHLDRGAYVMAITAPEDGPGLSPRTMSAVGSLLQHYPFLCGASSLASVMLAGSDKMMSAWESVRFPDSIILGVTTWFDVGVGSQGWLDVVAYHRTKVNLANAALAIDGHKLTEVPMRLNVMDNEVTKFWEQCSRTAEAAVRAALEPETQFYNTVRLNRRHRPVDYRPFCGFECWRDYVTTVVASDVDRDEPTCPTCGAES